MQKIKINIEQLLQARENRMQQKLKMTDGKYHMISLQLNIPGLPKSNEILNSFFLNVDEQFQIFYKSRYCNEIWQDYQVFSDYAGEWAVYLFDASTSNSLLLKELTEEFEESFPLGRIVDLDVLDANGTPISSGKEKPCFVCGKAAEACRKTGEHYIMLVRQRMMDSIKAYLTSFKEEQLVKKVTGFVTYALLQEVSLSPKPGLVCRNNNGAHTDMDYASFLQSIAMISPYFHDIGKAALVFDGDITSALPKIREIGLRMEQNMLHATTNINTHKGAIFLMSVSVFSIVYTIHKNGVFDIDVFHTTLKEMTKGIVKRELHSISNNTNISHGQQCFLDFGLMGSGARGEIEQGMPTVISHSLPLLNKLLKTSINSCNDICLKQTLVPVLLKLISVNNDTNVLYRTNKNTLIKLQEKANSALESWLSGNSSHYESLVKWCLQKGISPGGSADLLAVTILIHQCKVEYS